MDDVVGGETKGALPIQRNRTTIVSVNGRLASRVYASHRLIRDCAIRNDDFRQVSKFRICNLMYDEETLSTIKVKRHPGRVKPRNLQSRIPMDISLAASSIVDAVIQSRTSLPWLDANDSARVETTQ